jgi:Tfp pilus assembly protein PilV
MITLIATLVLAVVFFVSVTGLIHFQFPFMFGSESKKGRQNACQRNVLLENLVDTPTAKKL